MKIYGAGLAGLLAGCIFPEAQIFERNAQGQATHLALLRFRSHAVGDSLGIDFKQVTVHKGIYYQEAHHTPNILLANLYSRKVTGHTQDRSIWDIAPAQRWIAPDDLHAQLVARCSDRITWNTKIEGADLVFDKDVPVISTIPMPVMASLINLSANEAHDFDRRRIFVYRAKVICCDVHQTIYYPDLQFAPYRASIVGDTLIVECVREMNVEDWRAVASSFGIAPTCIEKFGDYSGQQEYGKLTPINDQWRKQFMFELSQKHNIFSLGRFATWRNILMDDVLKDIYVIKRLMKGGAYSSILEQR